MKRLTALSALLLVLVLCGAVIAAPAGGVLGNDIPKVTLSLQDTDIHEAMAQIEKVTGIQIAVDEVIQATVSADLKDTPVEQAVDTVVKAIKGSWMRVYLLETEGPPDKPYQASELLKFLMTARNDYISRLSVERREAVTARWQEIARAAAGMIDYKVGAHIARIGRPNAAAPPGGNPDEPGAPAGVNLGALVSSYDPLRELVSPEYKETISLDLKDMPLEKALDEIHFVSGFVILQDEDLNGNVTVQGTDADVEKLLDDIAVALKAKWRRVYVVTKPRPQSAQELEKRIDQGIDRGIAEFFKRPPAERQQIIQDITTRLQNLTPEQRAAAKSLPFGPHIMQKVMGFNGVLTAQQRQEIAPAVREVMRLFGGG